MTETRTTDQSTHSQRTGITSFITRKLGLRGKLLLALLPPIVAILLVTGYASYTVSEDFIDIALERSVKMHTLAMAHEVETVLDHCRIDLLFFAHGSMEPQALRATLEKRVHSGGPQYFELTYIPASGGRPFSLVHHAGKILEIPAEDFDSIQPNPFEELGKIGTLKQGHVLPSDIIETVYPIPCDTATNRYVKTRVLRLYTYFPGDETSPPGILYLSIKAKDIRNILSWYNSEESPLWAFPRSDELRFSYFLNIDGWMLFQSENYTKTDEKLTTYLARENYSGTLGKDGHTAAFRPNENHGRYWDAVNDIRNGKNGLTQVADKRVGQSVVNSFYFSYAPVRFWGDGSDTPTPFGGVIFVDRSQLPIIAGYKNLDVMLFVTAGAIILISCLVFWFGRILTRPIHALATSLDSLNSLEEMEEIDLPYSGADITRLQKAINVIIRKVKQQVVEIQVKDETILNVNKRERASLKRERELLAEVELSRIPEIIGTGPAISAMKVNILKAAQVDVDVFISGETGTGKQLVAEAIHAHSVHADNPFIAINCGALDENLLLDALFGHVKGAFSEAKDDRNGAFIEADGGTLFLDEIQSASPKVQQSLLRAIASRKIKPLGSDKEQSVNVRIIAATNVDIPDLIEQRSFREDLYYRLKVVSIATPALREQKENIPLLAVYYLTQAEQLAGRENLDLSKGALAKLVHYQWPGNVRELVNCITRAAVMAENDIIQAEEIRLENDNTPPSQPTAPPEPGPQTADTAPPYETLPAKKPCPSTASLNARQKEAWPHIQKQKAVTRKEYQELVSGHLPTRTAIYDLQDFVKRGLLVKQGKGPSTRYEVVTQ
ncbi:AAA family ATPase [Pseudodesulfovibrio sp. JC047]|uniref:sigma 54-interacting transcriptional regulator n=1 Tax=Pseudodesulfovibrio sp. JC047 TaxID=2683199 RepID=UPI0013D65979|nr:sigma-54 dependent transcriptional regulator [Pseudodesulfovibrio sp. JC047]NDV19852.1 AAA family ATPase [Pseudodesulfovibrio sp. JC047]